MKMSNEAMANSHGETPKVVSNILYDLFECVEWTQEPEFVVRSILERQEERNNTGFIWGRLGSFGTSNLIPANICKLNALQMPWQLAVGRDGRVIAILQDQYIEIRSSRDDYSSLVGRCSVSKDPFPSWRRLAWSADCSLLALAYSNGNVDFFDIRGVNLFSIVQNQVYSSPQDLGCAVAGMIFTDLRVRKTQWSAEFIMVNYKGHLSSFFVSPTDGYKENHSFSFTRYHLHSVFSVSYHATHQLLFVSGSLISTDASMGTSVTASNFGITAWRLLSDYPFYKHVVLSELDEYSQRYSFVRRLLPVRLFPVKEQDWVYKLSASPGGTLLAAAHVSGALSLWTLPSLKCRHFWELENQSQYNTTNPQLVGPNLKRLSYPVLPERHKYKITDINWWSEEALIIARASGAVTVSSIHDLKNLLGDSPEWFEIAPRLSFACDSGFLALECEQVATKRKFTESSDEEAEEGSDEEEGSILMHSARMLKAALYYMTDNERFQPPKKKPRLVTRTYRLLRLKTTTPEELFSRKIENEEYGEALALAKAHNLDCDLVYQRQWWKTPVSVASIQDYLSKITKRSWVLHECLERVPESIDAAKALLQYGLQRTDLDTLAIAAEKGGNTKMSISQHEVLEESFPLKYMTQEEFEQCCRLKEKQRREELLAKIDFNNLTLEQKQICQWRLKLLKYWDRLSTYEMILGGVQAADEHYDHMFFRTFRNQSGLEASIHFARNADAYAVASLFTYHSSETAPHRLAILSCFPETTSPFEYRSLLPEAGTSLSDPEVFPWEAGKLRSEDWCERSDVQGMFFQPVDEFETEFYEENPEFLKYRTIDLSADLLKQWYSERAHTIEKTSGLIDNALELVKLGRERNVKGLEKLHDDLQTMETLVYECYVENITLEKVECMSDLEKLKLMMSKTSEGSFVKQVREWLLPFLNRCEVCSPGSSRDLFREYIVSVSVEDLNLPLKIFKNSRVGNPDPIVKDIVELMSLALKCIYSCERTDQLNAAFSIVECLPQRGTGPQSPGTEQLHDQLDELEKHLHVAEIMEEYGAPTLLSYIKQCDDDEKAKSLLKRLTRAMGRSKQPFSESKWMKLLEEILDLQNMAFPFISPETCYEVFTESLLCCGHKEGIVLAGQLMECRQRSFGSRIEYPPHKKKVPYTSTVNLVLNASREYFNSSSSLSDPCMNLARCCLQLVEDVPAIIQEELDLISSLSLLEEFSIAILPLQVRLSKDRMHLIHDALKKRNNAYEKSQKLLELAHLLRVCDGDKCKQEGEVLILVAEAAYQAKDYSVCWKACKQLADSSYEKGWMICQKLGQCAEFTDIKEKCHLLGFALVYCTPDLLEQLLKAQMEMQLQLLCENLGHDIEALTSEMEVVSEGHTLEKAGLDKTEKCMSVEDKEKSNFLTKQAKEISSVLLHSASNTIKAGIASVNSGNLWHLASGWLNSLSLPALEDSYSANNAPDYSNLKVPGFPAFYVSLHRSMNLSKFNTTYTRFSNPDLAHSLEIPLSVLRVMAVYDQLEESELSHMENDVLTKVAQQIIAEDTALGVAHLLSHDKIGDPKQELLWLESTAFGLQLLSYYHALQALSHVYTLQQQSNSALYVRGPNSVISEALKLSKCCDYSANPEIHQRLILVQYYVSKLTDFHLSETLSDLGKNVDFKKLRKDENYKREVILSLARTSSEYEFKTVMSLARHFGMNKADVCIEHLVYLILDSNLSIPDIESMVKKGNLLHILSEDAASASRHLRSHVLPKISGTDLDKLVYYYSLQHHFGDEPELKMKPSEHLQYLKKLKPVCRGLNYKMLLEDGASLSDVLYSVLNEDNVHTLANLVEKLSRKNSGEASISVHCIWAQKLFLDIDSKHLQTMTDWLQKYDSCQKVIKRLSPLDLVNFVNSITFTRHAQKRITRLCRLEINKRALKYARKKLEQVNNDEHRSSQWQASVSELKKNIDHLNRLDDKIINEMLMSDDEHTRNYAEEFELTRSDPLKIQRLLMKIVIDGQPLSILQTILAVSPADLGWGPADAYCTALELVTEQIRTPDKILHPLLASEPLIKVLERILQQIDENRENLDCDFALEQVRSACFDSSVPTQTRLEVLQTLKKVTNFTDDATESLLLLFQTQSLVSKSWPNIEVTENNIASHLAMQTLFQELFSSSETVSQLVTLGSLLHLWPSLPLSSSRDPETNLWVQVLNKLSGMKEDHALSEVENLLRSLSDESGLSLECSWEIYDAVRRSGKLVNILKTALLMKHHEIHIAALEEVAAKDKLSDEDFDSEILQLILSRRLIASVVRTPLYRPAVNYIISRSHGEGGGSLRPTADEIAEELKMAGFRVEAGSLLFHTRQTSRGLQTFTSAFKVLAHWLGKSDDVP